MTNANEKTINFLRIRNEQKGNESFIKIKIFYGEFDPGSG